MVHSRIYCCRRMLSVCSICKDTPYISIVKSRVKSHNERQKNNVYHYYISDIHSRITQIYNDTYKKQY